MTTTLTKDDVTRLLSDPSSEARAEVAAKVAREVDGSTLTAEERKIAEDIVRALSRDAAIRVRQALSEELKQSKRLPHDIAVALARDVEAVSLPVLSHTLVLTDEDLIAIIEAGGAAKQVAIAARKAISAGVAEAIVAADHPLALATLVGNDGAELAEPLLQRVLERHGADETIQAPMAQRAQLPGAVLERLVAAASSAVRETLAKRSDLPAHLASELVLGARERATATPISPESIAADALALAQQLHRGGRLTSNLVVRAICLGDLAFVEAAFAVLADIPIHNARLLIYDAGPLGFKAIYERCKLPPDLLELMRVGLRVAQQTGYDGGANDRERHSRRTLERILTQYENIGSEDLEYLLGKLRAAAGIAA
ncbi:MAG TPA: DUF2336 domain-containing protein [Stellaceae bacterium]